MLLAFLIVAFCEKFRLLQLEYDFRNNTPNTGEVEVMRITQQLKLQHKIEFFN